HRLGRAYGPCLPLRPGAACVRVRPGFLTRPSARRTVRLGAAGRGRLVLRPRQRAVRGEPVFNGAGRGGTDHAGPWRAVRRSDRDGTVGPGAAAGPDCRHAGTGRKLSFAIRVAAKPPSVHHRQASSMEVTLVTDEAGIR